MRLARSFSRFTFFFLLFIFVACGSGKTPAPETPPQQVVQPVCPVCPPTPSPTALSTDEILGDFKFFIEQEKLITEAKKFGIFEKIGAKEITPEDFGKMTSFFWAVDPQMRISYLRALDKTNQLIDIMKPSNGKFDPMVPGADPDQEFSDRISEVIVDWAMFQRRLVDNIRALGVENVMAVLPQDDFPPAEMMMKDLLPLVAPPPETAPTDKVIPAAMRLLLGEAHAQTQRAAKGVKPVLSKYPAKAVERLKGIPPIKVALAPLLLARTMSFRVGTALFVLDSPLMAVQPQFSAMPVEQFTFKLEKKFIGDEYFNAVATRVGELANIPKRTQPEWMEMSYALTELNLLLRLANPNFGEAPPAIPPVAPGTPIDPVQPGGAKADLPGAAPAPALPATDTKPVMPSGALPQVPPSPADRPQIQPPPSAPGTATERPATAPAPALPSQPTPAERPAGSTAPAAPSPAERPSSVSPTQPEPPRPSSPGAPLPPSP